MTNQPPKQDRKWWECSKFCDLEHEDYLYDIPAILAEQRKRVVEEVKEAFVKKINDHLSNVHCGQPDECMLLDSYRNGMEIVNSLLNTKDEV